MAKAVGKLLQLANHELALRVVSAVLLLPFVLFAVWQGDWVFRLLVGIAAPLAFYEWNRLIAMPESWQIPVTSTVAATFIIVMNTPEIGFVYSIWGSLGLAFFVWILGIVASRPSIVWTGIGILYIALPLFCALYIRSLDDGFHYLLWGLIVVWAADIGAFFTGRLIGGPKLAPSISPNKTWSGLAGGLISGGLASLMVDYAFGFGLTPAYFMVGVTAAVAVAVGDLFESFVKRYFGTKDSGALIPGHGGLLDRIDGLLLLLPFMALFIFLFY